MCLIVDANVSSKVFLVSNDPNFKCMYNALFGKRRPIARIVYGGKLLEEYKRIHQLLEVLEELERAGRASIIADDLIDEELNVVMDMGLCCSNDEHIIALARASDARLLCTDDDALSTDFRNKSLVDDPRGSVYKPRGRRNTQSNCKRLLKKCCKG